MKRALLASVCMLTISTQLQAQSMDHAMMPGMKMPMTAPKAVRAKPVRKNVPHKGPSRKAEAAEAIGAPAAKEAGPATDSHAGHDMSGKLDVPTRTSPAADPHAGHIMPGMAITPNATEDREGTDLNPGSAPAPTPAPGLAASRYYNAAAMAQANEALRREHGGMTYRQILFNLAEYRAHAGRDGYRWDGEAWIGGDIDRLTVKSEGEGGFGTGPAAAQIQALYSHAIDPYWNLQAGLRYDFTPNPSRTYAALAIEGIAPFWFDVEGAVFLSDKGDMLARTTAWYDERVTQFFVLQPRIEVNLAAQDVRDTGIGAGLTDLELGLRLRYEKPREFAPYLGLSWERQFGKTARLSTARGNDTGGFSFVAGVRTWF